MSERDTVEPKTKTVCIIGGGISGLASAWRLRQNGREVTVLENADRVGGAIVSRQDGGWLAEGGPHSLQVGTAELWEALRAIPGLSDAIVESSPEAKQRFVVKDGIPQAVPTSLGSAVRTPLLSTRAKLRILREPFIRPAPADARESVAAFTTRRLGSEVQTRFMDALIGGIYAGDTEALSLKHGFPTIHQWEQAHGSLFRAGMAHVRVRKAARKAGQAPFKKRIISFREGMATLPRLLAEALGDAVHKGVTLEQITPTEGQWRISWRDGGEDSERKASVFDELIVGAPAHRLSQLPFPPEIRQTLSRLEQIDHPPVSVLTLGFTREQVTHPLDGFGALIPSCEKAPILGVLFPSTLFPHRAPEGHVSLVCFAGGARNPSAALEDTALLTEKTLPYLAQLLDIRGAPQYRHLTHWHRAIPQYGFDHATHLAGLTEIEKKHPSLQFIGNYRHGIALNRCLEHALLENSKLA